MKRTQEQVEELRKRLTTMSSDDLLFLLIDFYNKQDRDYIGMAEFGKKLAKIAKEIRRRTSITK